MRIVLVCTICMIYTNLTMLSNKFEKKIDFITQNDSEKIGYETLYVEILNAKIKHPEIVWAQAVIESGHFNSKVFNSNHNLFGMKLPRRRSTTATGSNLGYAVYDGWKKSVLDYKMYQKTVFKKKILDKEDYLSYLDSCYAQSVDYSTNLVNMAKKHSRMLFSVTQRNITQSTIK